MVIKQNLITKEDAPNVFFSSFEEKYVIMDNLDEKSEPIILARDEIYNSEYVYVTVVVRGTLHMIVGDTKIDVKSNDYLAVLPCMSVTVEDSRCQFFTFLTRGHIMADIYRRTGIKLPQQFHAFSFCHAHFTPNITNMLMQCYLRIKKEHLRKDYPMKELVLRSYQAAYLAKLCSFISEDNIKSYVRNTRQYTTFNKFISMLNAEHKKERSVQYYAQQMGITPKYLSAIIQTFTGLTASQVIDQYVIYAIKQTLYTNEHNIKTISKEYNFPSQSFFGRYFKRIVGVSPNEYIKSNNIKSINFVKKDNKEE